MLGKHGMPDVITQPLMKLVLALALFIFWASCLKLLCNARAEAVIHQVSRIGTNYAVPVLCHSRPLPILQLVDVLVELVWKPLGPCSQFSAKNFLKVRLEGVLRSYVLVSGGEPCATDFGWPYQVPGSG